jgi:hypothetical protein
MPLLHWLGYALAAVPIDPSCSDVPDTKFVDPPAPPSTRIDMPTANFCTASTTAELRARVVDCAHDDIVLAPGVYSPAGLALPFLSLPRTRRLIGTDGATVLQFGVSLHTHDDSALIGLTIDLVDAANAVPIGNPADGNTAAVAFWGTATGIRIQDVEIQGHGRARSGIHGVYAEGAVVERVGVQGFTRYGILLQQNDPAEVGAQVHDVVVRDVGDPAWREQPWCDADGLPAGCYAPGTAEHGIWLGVKTLLERAQVRDVWWTGVATANCFGGCDEPLYHIEMRDIDVDRIGVGSGWSEAGVGVGFERVTTKLTLSEFCVGPDTERGVHAEWNHHDASQSAENLEIRDGAISSAVVGVTFGSGTRESILRDLTLVGQDWAGIWLQCCGGDPETCSTQDIQNILYDDDADCDLATGPYGGACTCR